MDSSKFNNNGEFTFKFVPIKPNVVLDLKALSKGEVLWILERMNISTLPLVTRIPVNMAGRQFPPAREVVLRLKQLTEVPVSHVVGKTQAIVSKSDAFTFGPSAIIAHRDNVVDILGSEGGFFCDPKDKIGRMASGLADIVASINSPLVDNSNRGLVAFQTNTSQDFFPTFDFALTKEEGCFFPLYESCRGNMDNLRESLAKVMSSDLRINPALASMLANLDAPKMRFPVFTHEGAFLETEFCKQNNYTYMYATAPRPKLFVARSLDDSWRDLFLHRKIRGENKRGISSITRGYNYGSLSTTLQDPLEQTLGILDMLASLGFVGVFYRKGFCSEAVWSFLAMNTFVFFTDALELSSKPDNATSGCFKYTNEPDICKLMWVGQNNRPILSKDQMSWADQDRANQINANISPNTVYLTYLTPCIAKLVNCALYPTNHAHALDVYVVHIDRVKASNVTIDKLALRSANANLIKTTFPFHRTPFWSLDPFRIVGTTVTGRVALGNEYRFDIESGTGEDFSDIFPKTASPASAVATFQQIVSTETFQASDRKVISVTQTRSESSEVPREPDPEHASHLFDVMAQGFGASDDWG